MSFRTSKYLIIFYFEFCFTYKQKWTSHLTYPTPRADLTAPFGLKKPTKHKKTHNQTKSQQEPPGHKERKKLTVISQDRKFDTYALIEGGGKKPSNV